jgi:hypothetical protein
MTTLRFEIGRFGTNAQEVAEWLEKAPGCRANRFWVEIDPEAHAYVPIEELRVALEAEGFQVDLVPWPDPPPLPWWRYPLSWPRRAYFWARRVVLRESYTEQLARVMYEKGDLLHAVSTRESPMLRKVREETEE